MASQQNPLLDGLHKRLTEACDSLWDSFVDPREAYAGDGDGWWAPVAIGVPGAAAAATPLGPAQLSEIRAECRRLAHGNEFAINGHENRISYIVGPGHSYQVSVRKGVDAPASLAMQAQEVLEEFLHESRWQARQQEIVRRTDRDGEAFLRFFTLPGGKLRVRFIEPDQVVTPPQRSGDPAATHGVLTDPDDVEQVQGYYVDGRLIDAAEVQHRKANVDCNVKRGLPLYTPVRRNLNRADKLLRNMSVVAEIQSAIALIRKHRSATRTGVEQFASQASDGVATERHGRTRNITNYGPGTILDAPAGLEYDFPATGIDAASYVAILQAELRAVAARLVMPEFMFTSDASNGNYASTLVAEGPAVRMFERLQAGLIEDDCEVMWRVLDAAAHAGRIAKDIRRCVDVHITAPSLNVRDPLEETRVHQIAFEHGVLSKQTWSQRLGLDYDQEQKNLAMQAGTGRGVGEA
ncbi:MAG: phage portal protein [Planctomycetota bacterium]